MKFIFVLLAFSFTSYIYCQTPYITGDWSGTLKVESIELDLVFHINTLENNGGYESFLDSPNQGISNIPTSKTIFQNDSVVIEIAKIRAVYSGTYHDDQLDGVFEQGGMKMPLQLIRTTSSESRFIRPQEPKPPYPYISHEVNFVGGESDVNLSGTLTLPENPGKHPVAILISGSGPQNRDEEFMDHKPFWILADYLTKNGIAVLRYDDRGYGESTGNFHSATSMDFATDVVSAMKYLRTRDDIDTNTIGLIGHSEGGLIAPIVGTLEDPAFIVLMAAPGMTGRDILLDQITLRGVAAGITDSLIDEERKISEMIFSLYDEYDLTEEFEKELYSFMLRVSEPMDEEQKENIGILKDQIIKQFDNPWYKYFIDYNPITALTQMHSPVLAINGEKDTQVSYKNLEYIESALVQGGNNRVTTKIYENLNHMFQQCETGLMEEYSKIQETINPEVLKDILVWIQRQL